jgi:uncharacterized protein (TIGR03435 family)
MTLRPGHAQAQTGPAAPAAVTAAFEAASVKPSSPQAVGVRKRRDPGRLDYGNVTLTEIVADAHGIDWKLVSGPA